MGIVVGAVIIPLQITQFVEAFLDFRRDLKAKSQKKKQRKKNGMEEEEEENTTLSLDALPPGLAITNVDATTAVVQHKRTCQTCQVQSHHGVASFCWNCGSPLQ